VTINTDAAQTLEPELQPGERLQWAGRPDTKRLLVSSDLFLIPLSLMWGGFAIFWEASVLTAETTSGGERYDWFFKLWGVPFVLIGLYLIVGRFAARRYLGGRTAYALTDRRALVRRPTWRGGLYTTSVWLSSSPSVTQRAAANGHGTVVLGSVPMPQMAAIAGDPGWIGGRGLGDTVAAFWNIPDAADVGGLATRLISASGA
jgi:hypothetical protein